MWKLEGYVLCIILTIIILCIGIFLYFNIKSYDNIILYVCIVVGVILILWLLIPMAGAWTNKKRWNVYKTQIDSYINNGFTHNAAIDKIQDLYKTNIQANAMENGALYIGTALRSLNFNRKN